MKKGLYISEQLTWIFKTGSHDILMGDYLPVHTPFETYN